MTENNNTNQPTKTEGAQAARAASEPDAVDAELKQRLAEYDALKARAEQAEAQLNLLRVRDNFARAAAKTNARNAEKLFALVGGEVETDKDGKPKNIAEVIDSAKKRFPEEFGAHKTYVEGGTRRIDSAGESVDAYIRKALL
jgi:hypothetical protein